MTLCGPEGAHTKDAGGQQRRYNWTTRTVYDASCTIEASATPSSSFSPHVTSSANSPIANFPNEPMDVPEADARDDPQAFFATPGGKGAIAGITVGSVALTLLVLAALFWRRSKKRDSDVWGVATARRRSAMSTSSFGDDSGDAGSFMDVSGPQPLGSHSHHSHTMGEVRTSLRDEPSFVVESRRNSTAWTTMDPSQMPITSTVGAETAAAGLRPPFHGHQQSTGPERSDGADDGGDPSPLDRIPTSSWHEHEHNPFDDPTMPEAAQLSAQAAVPPAACALTRGGVERRKSAGFTSDTYRSGRRKSRPVSSTKSDYLFECKRKLTRRSLHTSSCPCEIPMFILIRQKLTKDPLSTATHLSKMNKKRLRRLSSISGVLKGTPQGFRPQKRPDGRRAVNLSPNWSILWHTDSLSHRLHRRICH